MEGLIDYRSSSGQSLEESESFSTEDRSQDGNVESTPSSCDLRDLYTSKRQKLDVEATRISLPDPEALLSGAEGGLFSSHDNPHQSLTRIRGYPHVEGNYATLVYLPVPLTKELKALQSALVQQLSGDIPGLEPMEPLTLNISEKSLVHLTLIERDLPAVKGLKRRTGQEVLHISLSRSFPIRYEQILPLLKEVKEQLQATRNEIGRWTIELAGVRAFVNDEGTRSFVSAMVDGGKEEVCSCIASLDRIWAAHGLPVFHQEPLPHVSLIWAPGEAMEEMKRQCALCDTPDPGQERRTVKSAVTRMTEALSPWSIQVDAVICRIGQRDHIVGWAGEVP